jgi:hypothetical protein
MRLIKTFFWAPMVELACPEVEFTTSSAIHVGQAPACLAEATPMLAAGGSLPYIHWGVPSPFASYDFRVGIYQS